MITEGMLKDFEKDCEKDELAKADKEYLACDIHILVDEVRRLNAAYYAAKEELSHWVNEDGDRSRTYDELIAPFFEPESEDT